MRLPKVSMENFNLYIKEVVRLACIDEPIKISYKKGNQLIEKRGQNIPGFIPYRPTFILHQRIPHWHTQRFDHGGKGHKTEKPSKKTSK